jgi:hypothetical protein
VIEQPLMRLEDEAESGLLRLDLTGTARSSSAERIENGVYQFPPVEAGRYKMAPPGEPPED